MSRHQIDLTVSTNAQTLKEVNEELSRLKIVIGVLLAKLPPQQRDEFIKDLDGFGFTEAASLYANFNRKD